MRARNLPALSDVVAAAAAKAPSGDWKDTAAPVEQSVAFALYTTHAETLKLTAQLYPLADGVDRDVVLSVRPQKVWNAEWREVGRVQVDETDYGWPQEGVKRWLAHFRVDGWDMTRDFDYRSRPRAARRPSRARSAATRSISASSRSRR